MGTGVDVTTQVTNGVLDALEYQDPILYQQEISTVFRKSWLIVARSSEILSAGDWKLYEGHGESVIATRQPDGSVAAFHNVCMHRGVRLTHGETSGCARRFTCPYHGWVYDTKGALVGLPDREDFASELVAAQAMPAIAAQEWAGFVWINLAGPEAPTLEQWTGPEIPADLAGFAMENMVLLEKQEFILDVNYKAVVDAFNEVYHAVTLHHTGAEWGRAAKDTAYHLFGPNSMSLVPRFRFLDELRETGDHHQYAICHYVVFPTTIFNCNPDQIQIFNPVPLGPEKTKFVLWELIYGPGPEETDVQYAQYREAALARWEKLQVTIGEDLMMFAELAATKKSMAYKQNLFGAHDFKLNEFHRTVDHCRNGGSPMDRFGHEMGPLPLPTPATQLSRQAETV
jgi:phenylpropionate dioxygenase-like ring-hydroxylating dioxygenase large terminal subunit